MGAADSATDSLFYTTKQGYKIYIAERNELNILIYHNKQKLLLPHPTKHLYLENNYKMKYAYLEMQGWKYVQVEFKPALPRMWIAQQLHHIFLYMTPKHFR